MARTLVACSLALMCNLVFALPGEEQVAMNKLKDYCRGCHGIGSMRFILGDDDEASWQHILANNAPNSGKLWLQAIIEVLDWPGNAPPGFDDYIEPPSRDWMPKGARRLELDGDLVDGEPTREFILRVLERQRRSLP